MQERKRADILLLACTQVDCVLQTIRSHSDHLKKVNNNRENEKEK